MRPKVFVSRIIPEAGLNLIREACDAEVWPEVMPPPYDLLLEKVKTIDGLLSTLNDRIDANLIASCGENLKVISQMSVGYDNIDVNAAQARNIPIGNTPGVLTDATADLAFALLLAASRRIVEGVEYIRNGKWRTWEPLALLGGDLSGATLGIIGLGRIGEAVARRAKGFDMRIVAYSPNKSKETVAKIGIELLSFDQLLQESDFVSIHVPLNAQTRNLINAQALQKMKPTAILINTARGPIVDQQALYEAVKSGIIGGAALDVTNPEPMSPDDPLLSLPNITIVPHIGSASLRTRNKMAVMAAENLIAGVAGKSLPNQVKV
ncbi:MAG: D-glycerate dehydrogenase [Anaerolineaceae bacterium]|nr:D-glycerate dehydrogenase [Anaerolineaceae bacterium]